MPVTVQSSFLIIAALIGFTGVGNISETIAWICIVFVSILIHELGHAFTARRYSSTVAIELNGLGGLTRWVPAEGQLTPGRRALIAASGSAVGIVFGGLVWLVAAQFAPYPPLTAFVLENIIYVNVFWGLVNWLPIRPLDGGHLLESLLEKVAPQRGEVIAKVIFTVTAAAALVLAIRFRLIFIAVLAGWLLLSEFSYGRRSGPAPAWPTLDYQEGEEPGAAGDPQVDPDPEDGATEEAPEPPR